MSILKFYNKNKNLSLEDAYKKYYEMKETPKCLCGEKLNFISLNKGYSQYCSIKCKDMDNEYSLENIKTKLFEGVKFYTKQFIKIKEYHNLHPKDLYDMKYPEEKKCIVCGKDCKYINFSSGYLKTCSYSCGNKLERRKLTPQEKKVANEKRKRTNIEKYGVECNLSLYDISGKNNPIFKDGVLEKKNNTMIERYGTIYPLQNKAILEKAINTNILKFGAKSILCNNTYMQEKMNEKYGFRFSMQVESLKKKFSNSRSFNINDRRTEIGMKGYVYILKFKSLGKMKIGLTSNLNNRFKYLKKEFGDFEILFLLYTNNMFGLEKYLHDRYLEYRAPENKGCGKTEFFLIQENISFENMPENIEIEFLISKN